MTQTVFWHLLSHRAQSPTFQLLRWTALAGGNPEGLGIWGEDKAEQLALQIAKSASSESEKRRRRFSCPKWPTWTVIKYIVQ